MRQIDAIFGHIPIPSARSTCSWRFSRPSWRSWRACSGFLAEMEATGDPLHGNRRGPRRSPCCSSVITRWGICRWRSRPGDAILVLIGIEQSRSRLVVAGCGLLGVGAAFHGFGLTALGFALLLVVLTLTVFRAPDAPKDRAFVLVQAVAAGTARMARLGRSLRLPSCWGSTSAPGTPRFARSARPSRAHSYPRPTGSAQAVFS